MAHDYHLGDVKPHVKDAAQEIGDRFNLLVIGGYRAVGSVANSDHPKGLALDLMTLSRTKGNSIAEYAIANAGRLGITYVIYWRQIWTPDKGWHAYDGPNPHIDHVHLSFAESGGDGGSTPDNGGDDSAGSLMDEVNALADSLRTPEFWQRVGTFGLGVLLMLVGIYVIFRKKE